ncbi:MAG: DUF2127 domain-containing protein [Minisyncoccota bacterium]
MDRERDILWFFDLALILKAVDGALEVLGAVLVLVVPPVLVMKIVNFALAGELSQDPDDPIANAIQSAAHAFSVSNHLLISLYLVLHGAIKVLLVIGIFAKKRIAYPLFMIALALFGTYEAYRGFVRGEQLLQALAIFDFILLILTAYEYQRRYPTHSSSSDTQGDYAGR